MTPTNGSTTPATDTPKVSATSLPVRRDSPPVASTAPAEAAPTVTPTAAVTPRRGRPRKPVSAPLAATVAPRSALTQDHLLDLGRMTVLAAKADMPVQEFVEDCRLLVVAWDAFQTSLGAPKA